MKHEIAFIRKKLESTEFKTESGMKLSLIINVLFAVFYMISAIVSHSAWMGTMAFYYIWLSAQRAMLTHKLTKTERIQWKAYFQSGLLLLLSSLVIVGMNILLLKGAKQITYPYYLLYGVAAYAFYSIISAIVNVVKFKRIRHPIYMAGKNISLVTAMISLLSLQSALLTAFGDDAAYNRMMSIITGFAIFAIVVILSVVMILRGKRQSGKE